MLFSIFVFRRALLVNKVTKYKEKPKARIVFFFMSGQVTLEQSLHFERSWNVLVRRKSEPAPASTLNIYVCAHKALLKAALTSFCV